MTERVLAEAVPAPVARVAPAAPAPAGRTAAVLALQRSAGNAAATALAAGAAPRSLQRCGGGGCTCGGACGGGHAQGMDEDEALLRAPIALSRAVAVRRAAS